MKSKIVNPVTPDLSSSYDKAGNTICCNCQVILTDAKRGKRIRSGTLDNHFHGWHCEKCCQKATFDQQRRVVIAELKAQVKPPHAYLTQKQFEVYSK